MALWESLILGSILLFLIYKWSTAKYNVLKERGVDHEAPLPLIGNTSLTVLLLGKKSFMTYLIETHEKFKKSKLYGVYNMRDPIIIVRDIELLKKVTIKDFDNFQNHRSNFNENDCLSRSVLALQDMQWKEMRNTLTPSFTGSKMRLMFELINECCLEGVKYMQREVKATGGPLELEMKEFFTRFANDVIASAAFGIKVNSFEDKTNEFFEIGRLITEFKPINMIKAVLMGMMPKIMKLLKISFLDEKSMRYFNRLVLDAIKYRERNNIVRNDMIHLLMEAKKQHALAKAQQQIMYNEFDDRDLLAQCLIFFFAGFDTVSTCLSMTAHELLLNPDIQQRLYEEILSVEKELNGKSLNYDTLVKMKYMDMVLSESLRKWPPGMLTDRVCSKDYTLYDDDGSVVSRIKKDDNIWIPIIAFHHDPENFPNPKKFDPERFSDERKGDIKPNTYLPFGIGPRNCIGNRLALMEIKSMLYHMLLHFKIVVSSKTTKDIEKDLLGFQMKPKNGYWMNFVPRTN